jgi:glycosyltransferase involved in cell wall biosynthesis
LHRFRPPSAHWILVLTVHGFLRTSLGLRALSLLNEHAMRYADVVVAVSSPEARRLSAKLRRTVHFIPNEVALADLVPRPEARRRLGIDPARSVVAFVGRLSPEKRPDLFVAMAARVALVRPEAVFVVIGSGDLFEETVRQAAASPDVSISFTGLVSDVASLMSCFDMLVCPSDTEGTPRVVIEAMFAGVPVVATRVGGLPDLISHGQTGLLVLPNSVTALVEQVTRLLDDPLLAGEISDAARARFRRTASGETMASRVTAAYRSGLADAAVPSRIGAGAAPTEENGLRA